jgi:hypothetical protein
MSKSTRGSSFFQISPPLETTVTSLRAICAALLRADNDWWMQDNTSVEFTQTTLTQASNDGAYRRDELSQSSLQSLEAAAVITTGRVNEESMIDLQASSSSDEQPLDNDTNQNDSLYGNNNTQSSETSETMMVYCGVNTQTRLVLVEHQQQLDANLKQLMEEESLDVH